MPQLFGGQQYLMDKSPSIGYTAIGFAMTYPMDGDLSGG